MKDPNSNFFDVQAEFNKYAEGKKPSEINGFKQYKRWEYFMEDRVDSDGIFRNAGAANKYYHEYSQKLRSAKSGKGLAGKWTQIGPFGPPLGGGSGRVNCIAFKPNNQNVILIGTASGGIWKSVNGGQNWSTNTDGLENLGISDIVFAPSNPNIVYAATGDRDGGDTYSIGVLKSTNGGNTWSPTGLTYPVNQKMKIYKLAVDPQNPNIVYAATKNGLKKTVNGGSSWTQFGLGSYKYVVIKPNDPNTIYAATSSAVIKYTAGGQKTILPVGFYTTVSRIVLGVTPADANYLYVLGVKNSDNSFGGLYRSTNSGASFTKMASSPNILGRAANGNDNVGQGWYDVALAVSPTDKNLLLVGGVNIWRSTNGGSSWALKGYWRGTGSHYVHADIHEIKFSPHSTQQVWACTDGGLSKSTNTGLGWAEKNSGLSVAQIYRLGASATNASKILTGWQDNGTNLYSVNWGKVIGGDGMECIIDYSNNNTMYGSLYYGEIHRSTNGGYNWVEITNGIYEQGAWVTPYVQDPNSPSTLYAGYINVYKTVNKGNTWQKISNFNTQYTLRALAVAPSNSNVIYAANRQKIYKTVNGGQSWTDISAYFNGASVTYIAVHPTNPNKLWITLSGFYNGVKVFKSDDGGATWSNISGSLPNLPANTIVYENNSADGLYVGMDVGVYYRDTVLGDWVPFMKNLPNVIVKELQIFYPSHKIRAATFGRGVWESPLYYLANGIKNTHAQNLESFFIYPNPSKGIFTLKLENGFFDNAQIEIYNGTGSLLKRLTVSNTDNYKIDLRNSPKGIYFVRILNNDKIITGKLIVE